MKNLILISLLAMSSVSFAAPSDDSIADSLGITNVHTGGENCNGSLDFIGDEGDSQGEGQGSGATNL